LEGSAFDFSLSCFAVCLLIKTAGLGAGSADWLETATSGLGAGWLGIVVSELDAGCLSVVGSFLGAFAASFTVSSGGLLKMSLVSAGCLGDSGIGSLTNSFLAGFASSSGEAAADLSGRESDSASVSLLIRRRETLDSWLGSRCKPMRPSFSTATKLVRTLDSGRGEPVPCGPDWLGVETPDVRPLSGGLVSSLFSNMARRFLTALMLVVGLVQTTAG
jgi:hypothetical protein